MSDFLKNLKEGDKVIINGRYSRSVRTVEKITPAGNIKVNGLLFNKNGIERNGDTWSKFWLSEATPFEVTEITRNAVISKARSLMKETTKLTFEQAQKIIAILTEKGREE